MIVEVLSGINFNGSRDAQIALQCFSFPAISAIMQSNKTAPLTTSKQKQCLVLVLLAAIVSAPPPPANHPPTQLEVIKKILLSSNNL